MAVPRTRFAPSPTGFLHLGSARTALFNWAYARRHGGSFVLRIEDTDRSRSTEESEASLLEGLRWLGLDWDEGPLRQSERRDRHAAAVERLIEGGHAYRCLATREEIEAEREKAHAAGHKDWVFRSPYREAELGPDCGPHSVRLKVPREGFLGWKDRVYGDSGQEAHEIGDLVIRRTDGTPLFYLSGAVDDIEMGITHVIRGADHHSNTPFQIALFRALGAEPPVFAHVPLIVGESGKKLSKRRDPVSVQQFREDGYLAEALDNWLVRLGWSHGDDEIFSLDEVARLFDLDAVGRSPARADPGKLQWLNQHYLRALGEAERFERARPFLEARCGGPVTRTPGLDKGIALLAERAKTLGELAETGAWMLRDPEEIEPKAAKHLKPAALPLLRDARKALAGVDPWQEAPLEAALEAVRTAHDVGLGKVAQPLRAAVTGRSATPGLFEVLEVVGREAALRRIDAALAGMESADGADPA